MSTVCRPGHHKADMKKLEKVQKRAVNMVAGLRSKNYADKLKEVGLPSLEERRSRGHMIQTFRFINEVDNVQAETWFTFASEREREGATSTRHSRDTTKLVQGDSKYELRRSFFSQRVPNQ